MMRIFILLAMVAGLYAQTALVVNPYPPGFSASFKTVISGDHTTAACTKGQILIDGTTFYGCTVTGSPGTFVAFAAGSGCTASGASGIIQLSDGAGNCLTSRVTMTRPTTAGALVFGTDNATLTFQGTGTLVNRDSTDTLTNKTITTPTILSFVNATHTHANAAGGGQLALTTCCTGILPVANGGTATATPALVQGTNITITGTWPNQTINAAGGGATISTTPNVIKGDNAGNGVASSIVDNGTTVSTTEPFSALSVSTGTSPPAVTAGTGGVPLACNEGTVPTVGPASGVDIVYCDATQHGLLGNFNNVGWLPIVQGPASNTAGDLSSFSGTNGGKLVDSNVVAANVATAAATLTNTELVCGAGTKTLGVCNLSGDVTTTNTAVTTVAKVNGVSSAATPANHTVQVVTASNTRTDKVVPDCTDTGGNHINFTQSTDAWSCGTSGGGGGGGSAGSPLFVQTASVTVTASGATTILGTGAFSKTIPAAWFSAAGSVLNVCFDGLLTTGAVPGTVQFQFKFGSTVVAQTAAFTPLVSLTNAVYAACIQLTARTIGASGTIMATSILPMTGTTLTAGEVIFANPTPGTAVTIDTTATQLMDLTVNFQLGATNSITGIDFQAASPGSAVSSVFGLTGAVGNLTGDVTSSGVATTIANNAVTFAKMATQAADTVVTNATNGTAVPTAYAMPTCSGTTKGSLYNTSTHAWECNTFSGTYTVLSAQFSSSDTLTCSTINTTETAFATTYTLPANYLVANKVIKISVVVDQTTTATIPTFLYRLKAGPSTPSVEIYSGAAVAPVAQTSDQTGAIFLIQGTAAAGASVNVETGPIGVVANAFGKSLTNQPVALATNGGLVFGLTLQCGTNAATNSATLRQFLVEGLN